MNTHNPYSPPGAPVAEIAPALTPVNKPASIWLLQILCAIAAILCLIGAISGLWLAAHPFAEDLGKVGLLTGVVLRLIVAALFVWTLIAAQRRSQFGRWLGAFVIGGTIVIMIFTFAEMLAADGDIPTVLGRYFGALLVLTPLGLLVYFPAFSKRARAWYAKAPELP